MSDDDEMEGFSVNDRDLERAFNPGLGGRRRQTKEQAMLGMWADDYGSSDDDEGGGRRGPKKFGGGKKSAGPISFVRSDKSSNQKQQQQQKTRKLVDVDDDEDNSSDDGGGGRKDKITDEEDEGQEENDGAIEIDDESEDSENEARDSEGLSAKDNFLLNQFQKGGLKQQSKYGLIYAEKRDESLPQSSSTSQLKGKKQNVSKTEIKEIGNWERHTKGIGAKLLQKMGWEKGKGIGKELQGRAIPVEATLRKGKGSVGAYGSESKEARKRKEEGQNEDEDDDDANVHVSQWKKDKKGKKPKYNLKSADELLKLAAKNPSKLRKIDESASKELPMLSVTTTGATNKIKVIDMTGKEQRVLHGYEALGQMSKMAKQGDQDGANRPKNFDLPELVHNIDMLIDMTEEKILVSDKKLKHYEDSLVALGYDERRTQERLASERRQLARANELLAAVEHLEQVSQTENDLEKLIDAFVDFQSKFADEFIIYHLSEEAIPFVRPLLSRKMLEWRPFDSSPHDDENTHLDYCKPIYAQLKSLLASTESDPQYNPYNRIVWETWMPAVRVLLSSASLKDHGSECAELLTEWSPLIPQWILTNILDQIVLPRLVSEVEEWNPLTDRVPIHTWVHPWLPLMKDRLDSALFPTIRFKLANALGNWHPSDESARAILRPWRPPVWSQPHWDAFMLRSILPKLEYVISQELFLGPDDVEKAPDPWLWVASWLELTSPAHFVDVIERCFFPKWFYALSSWLNSKPDYDQVADWYNTWKTRFGDRLNQHPGVKSKMSQGLIMMDRSMKGAQVSYTHVEPSSTQRPQPSTTEQATSRLYQQQQQQTSSFSTSLKDILERKASENNLMFLPVPNKFKEGKQVYRFGNLNIYLEGNVVFMLQNGVWRPTSISEIIQNSI